jgi:hypothetical protein
MYAVDYVHSAEVREEQLWKYETNVYEEFQTFKEYLDFKAKESETLATHPKLPEELPSYPTMRYFYFKGKLAAYQDCINWQIYESSID